MRVLTWVLRPSVRLSALPSISRYWLVSLFLLLLCTGVGAQEKIPQIAVIPVQGDENLTAQQLSFLTGQLSAELVKTKAFTVLERGQMEFILKEQGFQQSGACNSSECQVQMGQLLGVEYIVAGALVRFDDLYALRADYIDVASGKVVQSVDQNAEGELKYVYQTLCAGVGQKLAKAVRGKKKKAESVAVPVDSARTIPAPSQLAQEPLAQPVKSVDAEVASEPSHPLSTKRKAALALWGGSLLGAGAGYYFNGQGDGYQADYLSARDALDSDATQTAFDNTQAADRNRSIGYGVSISTLVVGAALWFWPEGK